MLLKEGEALLKKVRMRRYKEAWMRMARTIGTVMSGFWLQIVYFLLVFPFRIFTKPDKSGWTASAGKPNAHRCQAAILKYVHPWYISTLS